jgi:hypothetical protein
MLCDTCRWSERPGFIRVARPAPSGAGLLPTLSLTGQESQRFDYIPCPDCGGQAIAHCCEGLCEQPDDEPDR